MNNIFEKIRVAVVNYFTLTPYMVSQSEAEKSIREGVSFRGTNTIILIIAIFIASLGLNTNSTAVIIGAMLISPLMGPIIGIGLGAGIQDLGLLKRALRNLMIAAAFSIVTSTIYFLISPVGEGHSELLARTSPTIYDVLIGFFGGAAGIVAISSRSKGNVIPGVAIATALMPPLCTVGYGLATFQMKYFFGALYLFMINSIFICLATFIGVKLMKYQPAPVINPIHAKKVRKMIYVIATLTMIPSIYLTYNMLRESRFQLNVQHFVAEQCRFTSTHVLATSATWNRKNPQISITLIGRPLQQDSLSLALSSKLKFYGLQGATLNIIQGVVPDNASAMATAGANLRDIYQMTQASLEAKRVTIDSLRSIVTAMGKADSVAATIMPELRVVFPQVADIAVARPVMARASSSELDTLNVALVNFSSKITAAKREELAQYLSARLRMADVQIVDLPKRE